MILEPNAHFSDEDQEDKSGISVIARGADLKIFEVAQVQPGTPAAAAGIRKGDVIAGVDEDAASNLTLADLRDLFRQIGHQYKLVIARSGQTTEITVRMRRLL
jgi:S1-C subfamily serine protease